MTCEVCEKLEEEISYYKTRLAENQQPAVVEYLRGQYKRVMEEYVKHRLEPH